MDATIKEGNVGRNFSPVDKLKINLQNDGGESIWVPEDSVQLDELYTSKNGTYYAAPRDIYGWGVVTVDVDNSIDEPDDLYDDDEDQEEEPEGTWYFIDPDTGDRVDIEEDDDGWYFIDPDTGERVDIEEDEDGDPYFIDPETGERVDIDWDGDGEEPDNPWSPNPGGDDEDEDQDDDSWDDWEDDDWEDDDWEDDRITDGDDYDYIDDDGNLVEEECPASIKVVFPPSKTSYKDGEPIDTTGLYAYCYDKDGNVYREGDYRDGRVPNGELRIVPPTADSSQGIGTYGTKNGDDIIYTAQAVSYSYSYEAKYSGSSEWIPESGGVDPIYCNINEYMIASQNIFDDIAIDIYAVNIDTKAYRKVAIASCPMSGPGMTVRNRSVSCSLPAISGSLTDAIDAISENGRDYLGKRQSILVSWNDPCFKGLETSFDVFVTEDEEGSHHSGKF